MEIPNKLHNDIVSYCKVNNIINTEEFIVGLIRQAFTVEKYGNRPQITIKNEEEVELELEPIPIVKDEPTIKKPIKVAPKKEVIVKKDKDIYGE